MGLQKRIRIITRWHFDHAHAETFGHQLAVSFFYRGHAGIVRIETDQHIARVAFENFRMFGGACRAGGGDGVGESMLMTANGIELPFAKQCGLLGEDGFLRAIQGEEYPGFFVDGGLR